MAGVWTSWGLHLVIKPSDMQRPCVGAESKGHLVIPASQPSSHPYLNLASQKRLQTSWKWDKAFYCTVTEFQTHSVHEHDKMVLCHHICDGLLPSKDGIPCLSHTSSLSGTTLCQDLRWTLWPWRLWYHSCPFGRDETCGQMCQHTMWRDGPRGRTQFCETTGLGVRKTGEWVGVHLMGRIPDLKEMTLSWFC